MVTLGIFSAYKYHKLKLSQWMLFLFGALIIDISIIIHSFIFFGYDVVPIIALVIEEVGIVLLSLFTLTLMLRLEKEYKLYGFTINYYLVVISCVIFAYIIFPAPFYFFLHELDLSRQIHISNLFFSIVFFSMAIINQVLSKTLDTIGVIRMLLIILLGIHFGLEVLSDMNAFANNTLLPYLSWSFYHLTGSLAIIFIFLERLFEDFHHKTATNLNNYFMWSSSILAITAIPLGLIIRDRMGFSALPPLLIGAVSFILCSIVIWRVQRTMTNLNQQRENLRTIAYTDPLTGLYNYHGYLEKLSHKNNDNLLVISLNVEDFKSINDLYGRVYGDEVLKSLAKRLEKTPGTILVARTGSDYFQAVFRTTVFNMPNLIEKIRDHLGIWDTVNNRRIAVPLTYGASYSSQSTKPEVLARQAEQALKVSRNTHTDFTLYSKETTQNSNHSKDLPRHELREILQKAVDDNYLPIHFQPIYDLQSGNLKAVELLIRAESKEHGLLLPAQFLDQAKAYNLLTSLTSVCIHMIAKCYGQIPDVTININVPPYMLNNPQVLGDFVTCFKKENLPMNRFCIEVTEDGDIPTDHLIPAIKLLKNHGFKIAMDDFGTGYSSLSRLSVLPVDVVKIDRSLLLAASAGDKAILESAITLTKRLGASTVVEGVETMEQLELIKELGADSVQGYLLSKPVNISKTTLLSLNMSDIVPEFLLASHSNTVAA